MPRRRRRFTVLCTLVALSVLAVAADAGVVNRAVVGVAGRSATKGYSPTVAVVFASPDDYVLNCCVDGDSGSWKGPRYTSSTDPNLGGDSTIDWRATFTRGATSAEAAAQANLVQKWPVVSTSFQSVPHTIGTKRAGTIAGTAIVTKSPTLDAQYEVALAFPLCKGLFVVADFTLLAPPQDADGAEGRFLVNGRLASRWNTAKASTAARGVSVDGNLPPGQIVARAIGRQVFGTARDCLGHALSRVPVRLVPNGGSAITSTSGSFLINARKSGRFRVTATVAGSSASAAVTVKAPHTRTRTAR